MPQRDIGKQNVYDPTSLCPECGKVRHVSRAQARRHANRRGGPKGHVYQCGGFWHITSVSARSMAARRGNR